MAPSIKSFYALHSRNCSLVIDCRGNAPAILYWGPRLSEVTSPDMLSLLATRQELQACQAQEALITCPQRPLRVLWAAQGCKCIAVVVNGRFMLKLSPLT